jgi:hypothetical protein
LHRRRPDPRTPRPFADRTLLRRAARPFGADCGTAQTRQGTAMNQIIYIVGAIVIVLAILSFVGLR